MERAQVTAARVNLMFRPPTPRRGAWFSSIAEKILSTGYFFSCELLKFCPSKNQ
jgi:hypothetical protein